MKYAINENCYDVLKEISINIEILSDSIHSLRESIEQRDQKEDKKGPLK